MLPYLSPGRNKVTVSVADPDALGDNRLVVTYAYAAGYRNKSFEELYKEGSHLFAQQDAHWQADADGRAKDLHGQGPAGHVRRSTCRRRRTSIQSIRGCCSCGGRCFRPSGKPLPLPEKAQLPKLGPGDELKTLPNPFLIGSQPPPARPAGKQAGTLGHGFGERSR